MQNMEPLNVAFSMTQNVCLILHTKEAKQPTWRSLATDAQLSRYWLSVMCPDAVLQCTVRDTVAEGNSGETLFFFFLAFVLLKFHSWRRAVIDNRRGCAPSGKTLAGETERRTYGRVQWTDRETRTRLIISSCVINLDLNTIGREAQWTRHPTDRSICLHWWICSHTYMCTHAAAHMRAHTIHTHTNEQDGFHYALPNWQTHLQDNTFPRLEEQLTVDDPDFILYCLNSNLLFLLNLQVPVYIQINPFFHRIWMSTVVLPPSLTLV